MKHPDPGAGGVDEGDRGPAISSHGSTPEGESDVTVGTGSALGIGCIVAVTVFVFIALAVRWLTGIW